jgi:pimeloyl-ACP methyl ester carboxylesterase
MRKITGLIFLFLVFIASPAAAHAECVVLLHGLARTSSAMEKLQMALENNGYTVANVDYPSRDKSVEELSDIAVESGIQRCREEPNDRIHFVTHSLGGILVRYYLEHKPIENLGHVVMIAPPNHGSEIVDNLATVPGFSLILGPAGSQLGTDNNSIPLQLGPVNYSVGILAGTRTINPLLSRYLPDPDDGKVSVESTKVEGMADFRSVAASHPFIMQDENVISHAIAFIATGKFLLKTP